MYKTILEVTLPLILTVQNVTQTPLVITLVTSSPLVLSQCVTCFHGSYWPYAQCHGFNWEAEMLTSPELGISSLQSVLHQILQLVCFPMSCVVPQILLLSVGNSSTRRQKGWRLIGTTNVYTVSRIDLAETPGLTRQSTPTHQTTPVSSSAGYRTPAPVPDQIEVGLTAHVQSDTTGTACETTP
ncbi:hypothetical protein CHU98_g8448 [Xylaria longipes]|nr:hypothetical protein CHU98_g8448 [Xylaria longipes]